MLQFFRVLHVKIEVTAHGLQHHAEALYKRPYMRLS